MSAITGVRLSASLGRDAFFYFWASTTAMAKGRRITAADVPYWFGDVVYLRVRQEKKKGMVTGLGIRPGGTTFFVTWEEGESDHYDFELTSEFIPDYDTPEDE